MWGTLTTFAVHKQETGREVEQLGHILAPIWDACRWSSHLTGPMVCFEICILSSIYWY